MIDPGPAVHEYGAVGVEFPTVGTVPLGHNGEARSVQVYFGEVKVVGVLVRVDSHGGKPNDFILFIHIIDFANQPFSFGDWIN